MITSGGNRNPANADRSTGGRAARSRRTRPAPSAGPTTTTRARTMQQSRRSKLYLATDRVLAVTQ
jgi:hypothetical protein